MLGYIFNLMGWYSVYKLWSDHRGLAIFIIIVCIYHLSSLGIIARENDRVQVLINMLATLVIIGVFIDSFFV